MEENQSKRERNKAQHRASIMDAAEKLFLQKGFDNTSIDDVAKAAKLTKRTLYQYFVSKEDLYYAVALKGAKLLLPACEEAMSRGENALEKIRLSNKAYLQFYMDYLGLFRILNYTPSNQQNSQASPNFRELGIVDAARMKFYIDLVNEGMSDGSINKSLDTRKAVYFAFFAAYSLMNAVSAMNKSAWDMVNLDPDDFLRFSFDMIADALK